MITEYPINFISGEGGGSSGYDANLMLITIKNNCPGRIVYNVIGAPYLMNVEPDLIYAYSQALNSSTTTQVWVVNSAPILITPALLDIGIDYNNNGYLTVTFTDNEHGDEYNVTDDYTTNIAVQTFSDYSTVRGRIVVCDGNNTITVRYEEPMS